MNDGKQKNNNRFAKKNPIKVRLLVDRNKLSERCYSVSIVLIMLKNPPLEVAPTTLV